ncbi:hypothetical protein ACFSB1_10680 [Halopseudomonas phragmitis]|uniref:Uncharacterized protein n=1 Tax=Halopseudomonas phragmitis TaxID=1931241 RepID=A0A1V0B9E0_9GAMM|nr:hypothetical protein [Halopseudomonas phragmitis]AQZ96549.1 hypothetical protein BVH74_18125 [Halopseudomonas phragmitis]
MSCEFNWEGPLSIEAIDPYPWHGLVYFDAGQNWLIPDNGHPPRNLPNPPNVSSFSFSELYRGRKDAALWDLGLPEPPFSQCLDDAGAESRSVRLLDIGSGLISVNGVLRKVGIRVKADGGIGERELYDFEYSGPGNPPALAEFEIPSSILSGYTVLRHPYFGDDIVLGVGGLVHQFDRSPDGSRRLYGLVGSYVSGSVTYAFYYGVFEIVISADEDWNWSVDVVVIANAEACVGEYSYNWDENAYISGIDKDTGQLISWRYAPSQPASWTVGPGQSFDVLKPFRVGWVEYTVAHSGVVLGGWYNAAGSVELVRMSYSYNWLDVSDIDGTYGEKETPDSEYYNFARYRGTRQCKRSMVVNLSAGGSTKSYNYSFDYVQTMNIDTVFRGIIDGERMSGTVERDVIETFGELSHVRDETFTYTSETPFEIPFDPQSIYSMVPREPGLYAPFAIVRRPELSFPSSMIDCKPAATGCGKTFGFVAVNKRDSGQNPWSSALVTGVLTPAGSVGDDFHISSYAGRPSGPYEEAYYNPMTGETARVVDYPDILIAGWI